jgi:hypothetical protein
MAQNSKEKLELKTKDKWIRGIYMILFLLIQCIARFLIYVVLLFQFIVLFFDKPNKMLLKLGKSLSVYSYQIFLYLTYNTEVKPYPFSDWPEEK